MLVVTKNPSYLRSFRFPWISCRLQEILTRICARNARDAYCFCAHARKLVPDSVDSSTSNCWSREEVVRSLEAEAAEKSSASTPNASEKHIKRWRLRVSGTFHRKYFTSKIARKTTVSNL